MCTNAAGNMETNSNLYWQPSLYKSVTWFFLFYYYLRVCFIDKYMYMRLWIILSQEDTCLVPVKKSTSVYVYEIMNNSISGRHLFCASAKSTSVYVYELMNNSISGRHLSCAREKNTSVYVYEIMNNSVSGRHLSCGSKESTSVYVNEIMNNSISGRQLSCGSEESTSV